MADPYTGASSGGRRGGPQSMRPRWAVLLQPVLSRPERPLPTTAAAAPTPSTAARPDTAARAVSGAAYYSGPGVWSQDYATRNGIICQPGTLVRLEDGLMHNCQ